jgi:hypothetical protein
MSKKKPKPLEQQELANLTVWLEKHSTQLPLEIQQSLSAIISLYTYLGHKQAGYTSLLSQLHTAMGMTPKKESFSQNELNDPSQLIEGEIEDLKKKIANRSKNLSNYKKKLKLLKEKQKIEKAKKKSEKESKKKTTNSLTPMLEHAKEGMLCKNAMTTTEEELVSGINKKENFENDKGLHSVFNTATRYDFNITVTKQNHKIETVTDMRTGKSVTASTIEHGPKGFQVTWNAIAMMIIMTVSYMMPVNRLSVLLSTTDKKIFSSTSILNFLKNAAEMLEPIYRHLSEVLSNSAIWYGDDTTAPVKEMKQLALDNETLEQSQPKGLAKTTSEYLGRTYDKKSGNGLKKKVNISSIAGKEDPMDARSYIFFYRTHFGSVGNLADSLLQMRSPKKTNLTFLGDLSTTNYPSPQWYDNFTITIAGCSAHARRPYWRHLQKDEDLCAYFLRAFLLISIIENKLLDKDADFVTIKRFRGRYTAKVYEFILKVCKQIITNDPNSQFNYWPPGSEIYKACSYIVENFDALTEFIRDPRLPATNNIMERVLRPEALYKSSSKQTKTEVGRVVLDILRTIVTTSIAANIDVKKYLIWVFINHSDARLNPQNYTPFAYAKLQQGS